MKVELTNEEVHAILEAYIMDIHDVGVGWLNNSRLCDDCAECHEDDHSEGIVYRVDVCK